MLTTNLKRGEFFPFRLGPRMCIGGSFVNMELMLTLPMIGRRFHMEASSPAEPKPVPKLTLNPDRPIRLRVTTAWSARSQLAPASFVDTRASPGR